METAEEKNIIRLTEFSHSAGCGCKIAPAVLEKILADASPKKIYKNLLVGNESNDDAAVYDLGNGTALISTTDFFMPIVDDAFDFGMIAAANAISDVYAMGGKPILAIAILGWPVDKINPEEAKRVLDGARKICEEAHIPLAGGHSIDSTEPIFGLSVNGLVNIPDLKKNNSAREGDLLFLTKPIGTGILGTAIKRKKISEEDCRAAVEVMTSLNKIGEALGKISGVHALTDVTGFGLIGHLIEMSEGSGLSAEIDFANVPLIKGIEKYSAQFIFPDNTYRNSNAYESKVEGITGPSFIPLYDPQTSGGLLVSLDPAAVVEYNTLIKSFGLSDFAFQPIGKMISKKEKAVTVFNG